MTRRARIVCDHVRGEVFLELAGERRRIPIRLSAGDIGDDWYGAMPYETSVIVYALTGEPDAFVAEEVYWEGYQGVRRRSWLITRDAGRSWSPRDGPVEGMRRLGSCGGGG
ncbi:MAG: hypothetical protein H6713_14700 [Myxococcales bacterium]|nr:hypothetical protein [Myxococcales bacterium]MCB9751223.1 hypothetical protein [Myxococcales bacterium]